MYSLRCITRTFSSNMPVYSFQALFLCAAMIIAFLTGWLSARRKIGGQILDQLATMPLVFPGIVMGVAFLMIYLAVPLPIYGTIWALTIAYVVRYLPYGLRYTYAGVLQIHNELEEAAGAAGATPLQTLRRILAPLLSPALLSGWLFIFLIATKELAVAALLSGPRSQVVAVGMFDLWTNGQGGELALASQMRGCIMMVESKPTTSSRSWTIAFHQASLMFFFQLNPQRTVVEKTGVTAVDFTRLKRHSPPTGYLSRHRQLDGRRNSLARGHRSPSPACRPQPRGNPQPRPTN